MQWTKFIAVFMALLCVAVLDRTATAQRIAEWTAASSTAYSITGDITMSSGALVTDRGTRLNLGYVGLGTAMWVPFRTVEGEIYRVSGGGEELCNGQKPTFIVLSRPQQGIMSMTVFATSQKPTGFSGNCGVYNYQ
jgi:hypothetical protein